MEYIEETEESRTIFCGNLPNKATEELLYELFLQAGPLQRVRIPNDREGRPASYGFITFKHQCSVNYALNVLEGISLFNNRLNLKPRSSNNSSAPSNMPMQQNMNNVNMSPVAQNNYNNQNRTPSGRNDYYRSESLQGRWSNQSYKRDRDLRPNETNHRHNYKRHKR